MTELDPITKLKKCPTFMDLKDAALQRLVKEGREVLFEKGQELETPDGHILVVLAGEISCSILDAADQRFPLGIAGAGEVLGELSYLVGGEANDHKIRLQANSAGYGFEVPTATFFELVMANPAAAMTLLRMLAQRLAAMNSFAKRAVDVDIDTADPEPLRFGEKLADWISAKIGSWQFLFCGVVFIAVWAGLNSLVLSSGWDPYPFIFLNLVFSIISAATLPILLMSQNRQTQFDRLAARASHRMTLRSTQLIDRILNELRIVQRKLDESERKGDRPA